MSIYISRHSSRCGGIGRRARLKIWYSKECVGSTPSIGTMKNKGETVRLGPNLGR